VLVMSRGNGLIHAADSGNTRDDSGKKPGFPVCFRIKTMIQAVLIVVIESILKRRKQGSYLHALPPGTWRQTFLQHEACHLQNDTGRGTTYLCRELRIQCCQCVGRPVVVGIAEVRGIGQHDRPETFVPERCMV